MIPAAPAPMQQPQRWQALWRDAVREPADLLALLDLEALAPRLSSADGFPPHSLDQTYLPALRAARGGH